MLVRLCWPSFTTMLIRLCWHSFTSMLVWLCWPSFTTMLVWLCSSQVHFVKPWSGKLLLYINGSLMDSHSLIWFISSKIGSYLLQVLVVIKGSIGGTCTNWRSSGRGFHLLLYSIALNGLLLSPLAVSFVPCYNEQQSIQHQRMRETKQNNAPN